MGHLNLDTTRGYTAVFPSNTSRPPRLHRTAATLRPFDDLRPAEDDEWADFEEHFLLRRSGPRLPSALRNALRTSMPAPGAASCGSTPRNSAASRRWRGTPTIVSTS